MVYPTGTEFGKVSYVGGNTVADGPDADDLPDFIPFAGYVRITATPTSVSMPSGEISVGPYQFFLDAAGIMRDLQGRNEPQLVACDTPGASPASWTYTAQFVLDNGVVVPNKTFRVLSGQTTNLASVVSIAASMGVILSTGPTGATGPAGPVGPAGLPTGGTTGQVLAKLSATDGDATWQTTAALSNATPTAAGTAIPGTALDASRGDHVHGAAFVDQEWVDDRGPTGVIALPRYIYAIDSAPNLAAGLGPTFLTYLTAPRGGVFTQMRGYVGSTAAVTVTSAGMAVYLMNRTTGNLTKLGGVMDTSLWLAGDTAYLRTLDTSVTVARGDRLVLVAHCAATTQPSLVSGNGCVNYGVIRGDGGTMVGSGVDRLIGTPIAAVSGTWPASWTAAQITGFNAAVGVPYLELVP